MFFFGELVAFLWRHPVSGVGFRDIMKWQFYSFTNKKQTQQLLTSLPCLSSISLGTVLAFRIFHASLLGSFEYLSWTASCRLPGDVHTLDNIPDQWIQPPSAIQKSSAVHRLV
jgi:hypothetical protein